MKRLLPILACVSTIGICLLALMWPISYQFNLSKNMSEAKITASDCIDLSTNLHLGLENGSFWLYSEEMPYRGSMLTVGRENGPPPVVHEWGLGGCGFVHIEDNPDERIFALPGIYFERILTPKSPPWTTLRVRIWLPILFLTIAPLLWIFRTLKPRLMGVLGITKS